jgi:hypothetical protein
MRQCRRCTSSSDTWSSQTAPPGRCSECGRAFDIQGDPIPDENVTCPVHTPILASCPHPNADEAPSPPASWLVDHPGGS